MTAGLVPQAVRASISGASGDDDVAGTPGRGQSGGRGRLRMFDECPTWVISPCGCDCLGQPIGSWQSKQLPIVARNIVYLEFYTRGLEAYTPACFDGDRVGKMRPRGSGVFPFSSSIPGQRKQVQKKCPPAHIRTP